MLIVLFLPLLLVVLVLAKWERDKVYVRNQAHKAYYEGTRVGLANGVKQWETQVERMAKSAIKELTEKYPVQVKVLTEEPGDRDFYTGLPLNTMEVVQLPRTSVKIMIIPTAPIMKRFRELKDKWESEF